MIVAIISGCVGDPGDTGSADNWDGMDRSGWVWDGSQGDDSGNVHVVETQEVETQ